MSGHLLLTDLGPVEAAIIERAVQAEVPSVLIVDDVSEAGLLHDEGHHVMVKALDDPTPSASPASSRQRSWSPRSRIRERPTSPSPLPLTSSRSPGPIAEASPKGLAGTDPDPDLPLTSPPVEPADVNVVAVVVSVMTTMA